MIPGRRPEAWPFRCTGCGRTYPDDLLPHRCPACSGVYDYSGPLVYQAPRDSSPARRGIARFQATFPLSAGASLISLGEGGTPLLPVQVGKRVLHFKCEHLNPTGSYKDRGTAVLLSALWGALILYGTLATKQHWIADLPPAFVLAWVAHRWAWRAAEKRDR